MSTSLKFIKIPVTSEEQESMIRTLCDWNNWDYELCTEEGFGISSGLDTQAPPQPETQMGHGYEIEAEAAQPICDHESTQVTVAACSASQHVPDEAAECNEEREGECPHCFCVPCITTHRQAWLGNGQAPRVGNNQLRKTFYKHFWKMLDRRGAWLDARYLQKERTMFQQAYHPGTDESLVIVNSVRRIMPECVLDLVRGLYPNPPKMHYMGHKWE